VLIPQCGRPRFTEVILSAVRHEMFIDNGVHSILERSEMSAFQFAQKISRLAF
jgi:hypothetical protein